MEEFAHAGGDAGEEQGAEGRESQGAGVTDDFIGPAVENCGDGAGCLILVLVGVGVGVLRRVVVSVVVGCFGCSRRSSGIVIVSLLRLTVFLLLRSPVFLRFFLFIFSHVNL